MSRVLPSDQHVRPSSAKRATNLSLSGDVLDAAKALGLNVSQLCDAHLREVVRQEQEREWRSEHADLMRPVGEGFRARRAAPV